MPSRRVFLSGAVVASTSLILERYGLSPAQSWLGDKAGAERTIGGIRCCWCPPGRFVMGSPATEVGHRPDETQVEVTLTRGFWMAKFEVTQADWRRIVGAFPNRLPSAEFGEGDDFPAYWISYVAAEDFCAHATVLARRSDALDDSWAFRLPTEAQWEYACRAGTTTATAFGDRLGRSQANFKGTPFNGGDDRPAAGRSTPVGQFPANAWNIHDMHGNQFEWCRDWYHSRLPGGVDPDLSGTKGVPNRDGTYSRVRRGGAWIEDGDVCRSAFRLRYEPERVSDHIGFRVAVVQR
jgi:formylglycine-generating enzyme